MINRSTVVYCKDLTDAQEMIDAWRSAQYQTAGREEHILIPVVAPYIETMNKTNELLERIAKALETRDWTHLMEYPPEGTQLKLYSIPTKDPEGAAEILKDAEDVHLQADTLKTKPKKAKKA